ncbi:phasin family protein, partial [Actinoplanes campanulatus]
MPDAWRAYLDLALGLTEAPRKRAQQVAGELLNRGGATAVQVQGLVEDLLSAGIANREALTNIVRYEVDRALGRVGLATAEEVSELTSRVHDLERQLREAQARVGAAESVGGTRLDKPAPTPAPAPAPVKKAVAKKAVKAKPNAMPAAGTAPAAVPGNAATPGEVAPVTPTPASAPAPVKKAVKAAPVKRAPRKTAAKAVPSQAADEKAPVKKATAKRAPARKAAAAE